MYDADAVWTWFMISPHRHGPVWGVYNWILAQTKSSHSFVEPPRLTGGTAVVRPGHRRYGGGIMDGASDGKETPKLPGGTAGGRLGARRFGGGIINPSTIRYV